MQFTVLIIDDDPQFRRAASELLAARGYRVVGAAGRRRRLREARP
jgi:CheY-like chemotaxis protein